MTALGIKVWFDEFDLKIGDSLHRKIDEGLAISRYGIVILSTSFFGKHYTNRELDGLAQKEANGEKVILPIWVGVDEQTVRQFSLPLADRIAARWEDGLVNVVTRLLEVIKPEVIDSWRKRIIALRRLTTGKEVTDVAIGCHSFSLYHDNLNNEPEIDLVGGFLQELQDWCDIWDDIDISGQMKATLRINDMIQELEAAGWSVYGIKMKNKRKISGAESEWIWYTMAVLRDPPEEVVLLDGRIFILRSRQSI